MRNRKLILGGVGLAITALISAASIKNFYLWHDGMHNQVASNAISYQQEGAVLKIGEECYSIDEVDSITFDTPVSPSNMPRTRMMFDTGSSHDMKLRSSGTYSYVITTTGSDPYVSTRPLTRALPEDSCILTFEYRLNKRMPRFKVYFATPLSEERSAVLGLLEPTNLWQRASFDLYAHRTAFEWGRAGHYLRLDPGEAPDVTLEIRNIYLRRATAEEIAAREAVTDHFKYMYVWALICSEVAASSISPSPTNVVICSIIATKGVSFSNHTMVSPMERCGATTRGHGIPYRAEGATARVLRCAHSRLPILRCMWFLCQFTGLAITLCRNWRWKRRLP